MTNKKSLLSIAAALAISSTIVTASYIPLSTADIDNRWVLFGVSGLMSDGTAATDNGVFVNATPDTTNQIIDSDLADELGEQGMTISGTSNHLAELESITLDRIEVRLDTTGIVYDETDPYRTIYVSTNGDNSPDFSFKYKASLEGKTLEYTTTDGGKAYYVVVNYINTYDNPAIGTIVLGQAEVLGTQLNSLTSTNSAVDYNLSDNPDNFLNYTDAGDYSARDDENLRVYGYDAENTLWNIYDTGNSAGTNDFTEIVKSKGYWAKLDTNSSTTATVDTISEQIGGMVLGTPSLTTANYVAAGLSDGWNLIAFDGTKPEIRNAATGMILTMAAGGGVNDEYITITDASGNHKLSVDLSNGLAAGITTSQVAEKINSALYAAKLAGTIPYTFDVKAYSLVDAATTGNIALISNEKFSFEDNNASGAVSGAMFTSATTLNGAALWDENTTALSTDNLLDANEKFSSIYGEYAVVVKPLYGTGTANDLGSSASIDLNGTVIPGTALDGLTEIQGDYDAITGFKASEIDLDNNGTTSHILIAASNKFNIRDHTFTRVFSYSSAASAGKFRIDGGVPVAEQALSEVSATAAAADIDSTTVGSAVVPSDATKIVMVMDAVSANEFTVAETEEDQLTYTTTTDDIAKGAISDVFSLSYLAKKSVINEVKLNILQKTDTFDDNLSFSFTDIDGTSFTPADLNTSIARPAHYDDTNNTDNILSLDTLVTHMQTALDSALVNATARHNYISSGIDDSSASDAFEAAFITITGPDINNSSISYTSAGGTAEGTITSTDDQSGTTFNGDLTRDLKYNIIYAPDFPMDGPLYTMRDANMSLKALISGTMDLSDDKVSWSSIDLTRKPSEWLDSQDYNLFEIDAEAGYWAYLETDTSDNPLSIGTAIIDSQTYKYYFDTDGTTYNYFSGNLKVQVLGLTTLLDDKAADGTLNSARVRAIVNGKTIELIQDGTTDVFTGKISVYESEGLSVNEAYDIIINVADGLGNNLSHTLPANTFDNLKPAVPTVVYANDELNITHTDPSSVTGYYVFDTTPPEYNANGSSSKIDYLALSSGTVPISCTNLTTTLAADTPAGGLKVYAIDGTGLLEGGNMSDATDVPFMPILRLRSLITNSNSGTVTTTSDAVKYDITCTAGAEGAVANDDGMSISAITAGTVKMAYEPLTEELVVAVPYIVYVDDGAADNIMKISYSPQHAGKVVFVEINEKVYGFDLPDAAIPNGTIGSTSTNPIDLDAEAENPKVGIRL